MASTKKARSSAAKKTNNSKNSSSAADSLLNGNQMEIIVAALLLTGKLRVDAVQLFRQATMIVSLTGRYKTIADSNNTSVNNMIKFLNDNGNMTLDDVIQAFKMKTE